MRIKSRICLTVNLLWLSCPLAQAMEQVPQKRVSYITAVSSKIAAGFTTLAGWLKQHVMGSTLPVAEHMPTHCAICTDQLDGEPDHGAIVRATNFFYCPDGTSHRFHDECIAGWIETQGRRATCPLCRGVLRTGIQTSAPLAHAALEALVSAPVPDVQESLESQTQEGLLDRIKVTARYNHVAELQRLLAQLGYPENVQDPLAPARQTAQLFTAWNLAKGRGYRLAAQAIVQHLAQNPAIARQPLIMAVTNNNAAAVAHILAALTTQATNQDAATVAAIGAPLFPAWVLARQQNRADLAAAILACIIQQPPWAHFFAQLVSNNQHAQL